MKNGKCSWLVLILAVCMTVVLCCAGGAAGHAEPSAVMTTPAVKRTAEGGLSPEAAAEGYIYRAFGMPGYVKKQQETDTGKGTVVGGGFTDEKQTWLYNALKAEFALVAAGQRESTQFTFPVKNAFREEYTAAEWEYVYDPVFEVLDALIMDCPYELYWFDKTKTGGYGVGEGAPYDETGGTYFVVSEDEGEEMTFRLDFAVAADYSVSGEPGTYAFNTELGQAVQTAVQTAADVRDEYAALGNYAKLAAYKDWICAHVDYNTAALGDDVLYGDPWQMVYVFDGNNETDVVCEGYSKAFQHLCDISTFSGGVTAVCVSGTMGGGTGEGPHMWNIVKMDDGKYYLADITNSDAGSVGSGGELFLKGYTRKDGNTYIFEIDEWNSVTYAYDGEMAQAFGAGGWLNIEQADYEQCENHEFEGGVCIHCGTACTHDGETSEQKDWNGTNDTYTEIDGDDEFHTRSGDTTVSTVCDICGETIKTAYGTDYVSEVHTYNDEGECTLCGHRNSTFSLPEFDRPEVNIEEEYEQDENIVISFPWVEGAEYQRIYILNEPGQLAFEGADITWNEVPASEICEYCIDGGTMVPGVYSAWIELHGTGYLDTGFSYRFEIVGNTTTLSEFDEPDVTIKDHYEPNENIVISFPWMEGADIQSVTIYEESTDMPYDETAYIWYAAPDGGICSYEIPGSTIAEGEYYALIELQGEGYCTRTDSYGFEVTSSTLPLLTVPETASMELDSDELEIDCGNAAEYAVITAEVRKAEEGTEFREIREDWCEWSTDWGTDTGTLRLNSYAFPEAGTYEIGLTQKVGRNWGWKVSGRAVVTVTVTGWRPAVPEVAIPAGEKFGGEQIWITVTAPGTESVRYSCTMNGNREESETYTMQGSTISLPYTMYWGEQLIDVQVMANGVWSSPAGPFLLEGNTRPVQEMNITVPADALQGQDVTASGIQEIEGATVYTYSVGWYDEEMSQEDGIPCVDQIIYDEPFEPVNGQFAIPGCNFMLPGKYYITISAYRDGYGDWLGEGNATVNITENPDAQAAPAVTLLTRENLYYGKTKFRVSAAGADRIYVSVSRKDDDDLFANPVTVEVEPEKTVHTVEWLNSESGNMVACFVACRNGIWSPVSEPVEYNVEEPDDKMYLGGMDVTCPDEVLLGNTVTFRWDAVPNAQTYEFRIRKNSMDVYSASIPASQGTSVRVNTSALGCAGEYEVRMFATAPGYWESMYDYEFFRLLDPARKITAELLGYAEGTAYLKLSGVDAELIRVKSDRNYYATIPVGPGRTLDRLVLRGISEGSVIRVANYGTDETEWGAWSDGITAQTGGRTLPAGLTGIEAEAFEGTDFETVVIPEGCTEIGDYAFRNCTNLKTVYIPDSCGTIGDYAFSGCTNLVFITYPARIAMGEGVFAGCGDMVVIER